MDNSKKDWTTFNYSDLHENETERNMCDLLGNPGSVCVEAEHATNPCTPGQTTTTTVPVRAETHRDLIMLRKKWISIMLAALVTILVLLFVFIGKASQNQAHSAHTAKQGQGQLNNFSSQDNVRSASPRSTDVPAPTLKPVYSNCTEALIDECAARKNPCENNERCIDEVRGFKCIDDCAVRNSCLNGGTCVNGRDNSTCICGKGFIGPNCGCSLSRSVASLPVVSLGCGGLIEIPNFPERTSFLLDYKSNVFSNNIEHCMWTFNNVNYANSRHYQIRIQVTLQCEGFVNSGGAVSVLDWKEVGADWRLSNNVLSGSGHSYVPTTNDWKLFLSYSSGSSRGSGFLVLINVLQVQSDLTGSNFVYTAAAGTRNYGPYVVHDKLSIVVNPSQANTTLTVDYLDSKRTTSCYWEDTLDIFEIRTDRGLRRLDRLCGSVSTKPSYKSDYPFLVMYFTRISTSGRGFQISWK